jgi:hypothetical protein
MKIINSLNNIKKNSKIAIYGIGETGREFYNLITKFRPDIKVLYFFDSFNKKKINNIPVIKNIKKIQYLEKTLDRIVVCSIFWNEINSYLHKHHIKKNYIISNFLIHKSSFLNSFGAFYFNKKKINLLKKKYNKIIKKISCSVSREVYKNNFNLRAYKKEKIFFIFAKNFYYKYKFLINNNYLKFLKLKKINYALDAGVYDGKESLKFLRYLKQNLNFRKLFGFEPNSKLFKSGSVYKIMNNKHFELYENILSNKNKLLKFYIDHGSSSRSFVKNNSQSKKKSENNIKEKNIKAVTIDFFLKKRKIPINFLRLDIEGAEMKVLEGAKQSIIKYKPQILISIYHKK